MSLGSKFECDSVFLFVSLTNVHMYTQQPQQPAQQLSVSYALNVAPSINPVKVVVVVAAVLGSRTVAGLVTQTLTIPGTRESKCAKHGDNS